MSDQAPGPPGSGEISIVIPAYNEAGRIGTTVAEVLRWLEGRFDRYEVIVVDDGSRDSTGDEAAGIGHPALRVLRNEANSGKGFSVRRGVLEAAFDPILFTDADLSTPIEEAEKLLAAMGTEFDGAIASRRLRGSRVHRSLTRRILGWGFGCLVAILAVRGYRDTQCGFKMFRRRAAREIFSRQTIDRWGFDVEILAIARRMGCVVVEVPVRWSQSGRSGIRLGTPIAMAIELLRIRRNLLRGRYDRP